MSICAAWTIRIVCLNSIQDLRVECKSDSCIESLLIYLLSPFFGHFFMQTWIQTSIFMVYLYIACNNVDDSFVYNSEILAKWHLVIVLERNESWNVYIIKVIIFSESRAKKNLLEIKAKINRNDGNSMKCENWNRKLVSLDLEDSSLFQSQN